MLAFQVLLKHRPNAKDEAPCVRCPLSIAPFVARDRVSEGTFTAQDGLPG